ncbi:TonB-dependent receptor [Massilia sp. CCM 8734]|uniref:TonB-dependent receptor plug domain-containing protein n=1 Tax=Massilia sp. CCM 8734 TaxID=2609283 RepID=UPI00141F9394|nr:TonB-dependent receptor [Massilia sp. CCM 8734]NIA00543.1 TonB-dependent receptor [Massilia sp. CCM 8734]
MTFPVVRHAALTSLALAFTSPCALADSPIDSAATANTAVIITAARAPQPSIDVLSDHVLISATDIARSGAGNVVDLLQKQRGIEITRNGGPGAASQVFIRGGDPKQTVVLVDGVRIGSSTIGIANWATLPLANIDRVEIVYGPLATMYGADAIGGVVQIFTRRGAGPASVTASVEAGSDKARAMTFGVAGASEGENSIHYAFGASKDKDEGFSATKPGASSYNKDNDGYARDSASGQLGIVLAKGHEAGLLYLHSHLASQYDSGPNPFDVRSVQNMDNIAVYSKHQFTTSWKMSLQASEADDKSVNFTSATASNRIDTRAHAYSMQHDIALGSDLLQLVLERRVESVFADTTRALNASRATNSVAAAYSAKRGNHLASASARRDDSTQYGDKTTGGIGYGYKLTRALRVNASAGTSFRAPTFNELYYPGYGVDTNKPEQGKNVEGGAYYNDGTTEASAIWYRNRLTDLLVNTGKCPVQLDSHPNGCAYNVNRATLEGVSLGARTRLGDVDMSGSLDFQDPRDDTTGKNLQRRAKRHAKFAVEYNAGDLIAGVGVQVSGKRFDDLANRTTLPGYGVVNLFASYRFAHDWSAVLRLNNIADKQYELARNYATAGRQVFAGIRYGIR